MSFRTIVVLLFSIIVLASCTRRIPLSTLENIEDKPIKIQEEVSKPDTLEVEIQTTEIKEIEPPKPKRFIVTYIEKARGVGKSKIYNFSLHNDGLAFYKGKEGISPLGQYYGNVPKEKVQEILVFIEINRMQSYASFYPTNGNPVKGIPLTLISVATNPSNELKIKNYHHAPKPLIELEKMVEELIRTTKWTPTYE